LISPQGKFVFPQVGSFLDILTGFDSDPAAPPFPPRKGIRGLILFLKIIAHAPKPEQSHPIEIWEKSWFLENGRSAVPMLAGFSLEERGLMRP